MKWIKDFKSVLNLTVIIAGLGYFVDLYDITLFGVVRMASLKDIGITDPAQILEHGLTIYNWQMGGMMLGGLLWGILADKRGRLSVMFASILLYSLANIANAFVTDPTSYAVCRFLGGLGLAGELGAAVTLVAESLPKDKRGLGTTIVATLGMLGILAAALVGKYLHWQYAYISGGVMGLLLLFARFKIAESHMVKNVAKAARGKVSLLLEPTRLKKYLACIAIGVPIYFTTGILFTFAPELTAGMGLPQPVSAADAILYGSIGLTLGDLLSGILSQQMRSRRGAVGFCLVLGFVLMLVYGFGGAKTRESIYLLSFLIGLTIGYWAVLVTMAAEQFGTNIRATVATSVPNFVRGSAVLAVTGFKFLKDHMTVPSAAMLVGVVCFGLALVALFSVEETFGKDLDFEEGVRAADSDSSAMVIRDRDSASQLAADTGRAN